MIQIFTDSSFISPENRSHVFPILFDLFYIKSEIIFSDFQISDRVETSDVIVVPVSINRLYETGTISSLHKLISLGKQYQKPVWVYTAGDYGISMTEELVNFRLSGFDSKMSDMNEIMPSFINDPYIKFDQDFQAIEKRDIPEIGFVGQALKSWGNRLKYQLNWAIKNGQNSFKLLKTDPPDRFNAPYERWKILKGLEGSPRIKSQFILNRFYRDGVLTAQEKQSSEYKYFKNIFLNPYTLCVRGAGNFSVRFYETLAMGRIPIYVESDARLPLEKIIKWDEHIVRVKQQSIESDLIEFHENTSEAQFKDMQEKNRRLWETHLTRGNYFRHVANSLI